MLRIPNYLNKTYKPNSEVYNNVIRGLSQNSLYPCDLGIIFFNRECHNLFKALKQEINTNFDKYFYEIKKIIIEYDFISQTKEKNLIRLRKELIYPTSYFYEKISELKSGSDFNIGVGITDVPIYSSTKNNLIFLYGEAHLHHNCAIISNYNLKYKHISLQPYNNIIEERIVKEVIHEIGHFILGPKHCRDRLCVMSSSKDIWDVDKKGACFCRECQLELERIKYFLVC